MSLSNVLVTGAAGFIGSNVVDALLATGQYEVYCVDNFDPYYDPRIKLDNLRKASADSHYHFIELDLRVTSPAILVNLFKQTRFDAIIHLAARAGVRPSIDNPVLYYDVNVKGTIHLLDYARQAGINRFLFASSSSVYGTNPNLPWKESDPLLEPISPYAATKIAAEEIGRTYAHLYQINFIALRLFTVYGPRQRPDLAIHRFYNQIHDGEPINIFGNGTSRRDYTFVGDITDGIVAALQCDSKGFDIFNLGNHQQVTLGAMIESLERCMQKHAQVAWKEEQPGDVSETYADISKAETLLGYHPRVNFIDGIRQFVEWKEHSGVAVTV